MVRCHCHMGWWLGLPTAHDTAQLGEVSLSRLRRRPSSEYLASGQTVCTLDTKKSWCAGQRGFMQKLRGATWTLHGTLSEPGHWPVRSAGS